MAPQRPLPPARIGGQVRRPISPVKNMLARYINSPNTMLAYNVALRHRVARYIREYGGEAEIGPEQAAEIIHDLKHRGYSVATVNQTLTALAKYWDELIRLCNAGQIEIEIEYNPWRGVKREPEKQTLGERILDEDEVRALFAAANPGRDRVLLRFLYVTGCRVTEAITLRWRDIRRHPEAWMVTVFGKRKKTRHVQIPPVLGQQLEALGPNRRPDEYIFAGDQVEDSRKVAYWRCECGHTWRADDPGKKYRQITAAQSIHAIRTGHVIQGAFADDGQRIPGHLGRIEAWHIVHRAAEGAGLEKQVSPHWLRHAHATHALSHGAQPHVVQITLGHKSLATTSEYIHLLPGQNTSSSFLPDL